MSLTPLPSSTPFMACYLNTKTGGRTWLPVVALYDGAGSACKAVALTIDGDLMGADAPRAGYQFVGVGHLGEQLSGPLAARWQAARARWERSKRGRAALAATEREEAGAETAPLFAGRP